MDAIKYMNRKVEQLNGNGNGNGEQKKMLDVIQSENQGTETNGKEIDLDVGQSNASGVF